MSHLLITLFAYLIYRYSGEFSFMKHPLVFIEELITFFEEKFYKDSVMRGGIFVLFVVSVVSVFAISLYLYLALLPFWINVIFSSLIASLFVGYKVKGSINNGIIEPLFYLLLFNLPGIILYKTIDAISATLNCEDEKYKNYGRVAVVLEKSVNFIPSHIRSLLIKLLSFLNKPD